MIKFTTKGNFDNLEKFLKNTVSLNGRVESIMHKYGKIGVSTLSELTPIGTGKTASSWDYQVIRGKDTSRLVFTNSHVTPNGVPIAILLQYGHATGTGGYVEGIDFVNPAMASVFNNISNAIVKEVNRL